MASRVTPAGIRQLDEDRGDNPASPWSLTRILFGNRPEHDHRGRDMDSASPEVADALAVVADPAQVEPHPDVEAARAKVREQRGKVGTIEEVKAACTRMKFRFLSALQVGQYHEAHGDKTASGRSVSKRWPQQLATFLAYKADREYEAHLEDDNRRRWRERAERNKGKGKGAERIDGKAEAKAEARAMRASGTPVTQIAKHFGVSRRTIYNWFTA